MFTRTLRATLLGAIALLMGCEATRPPCSSPSDCFVGEDCVSGVCVASPLVDMEGDVSVDVAPDVPIDPRDCRIAQTVCEPKPCNTTTGRCIECEFDRQCGTNGVCNPSTGDCACLPGFHRCGTQCVSDDDVATCGKRCEPCPGTLNGFGFCESQTCKLGCNEGWLRCDESCSISPLECVACLTNLDCPADNPVCNGGMCTGCRNDTDCQDQSGLPVCHNGACVQCTEGKKIACGGNTCNPATNICTETLIKSLRTCERCVSDDDCQFDSEDCVKMNFRGIPRPDGYCLYRSQASACYRPFGVRVERSSISGGPATSYCTVNENELTCEALRDYGSYCDIDSECGVTGLNDGLCRPFSGARRCTFSCDSSDDCPTPFGTTLCATYCRAVNED